MATMATQQRGSLEFVHVTHPDDVRMHKQQVRAQAARNFPARQNRVIRYQTEKHQRDKRKNKSSVDSFALRDVSNNVVSGAVRIPGALMPLSAARTDPFDTFVRKITKFENILLDYFVKSMVSHAAISFKFTTLAEEGSFRRNVASHLVQMAAGDTGLLAALFLAACRHLGDNLPPQVLSTHTLQYRGECISALNTSISQEGAIVSGLTIMKALTLASDALLTGDYSISNQHLDAARRMVAMRSDTVTGSDVATMGMNGALQKLVLWISRDPLENGKLRLRPCICVESKDKLYAGMLDVINRR